MGAPAQDMRRPAQLQAEFLHGKSGQALELPKGVVASPALEVPWEGLHVALSTLGWLMRSARLDLMSGGSFPTSITL